ncbi:M17 family metallopeptidase [Quadrisphaera setariae]|nr:leucyl aminopeptidase family protein [Quadrisphaera setariae]
MTQHRACRDHAAEVEAALAVLVGVLPLPLRVAADVAVPLSGDGDGDAPAARLLLRRPDRLPASDARPGGARWPAADGSLGGLWPTAEGLVVGLGAPPSGGSEAPGVEPWLVAGEAAGRCLDRDVVVDMPHPAATIDDEEAVEALLCGLGVGAAAARLGHERSTAGSAVDAGGPVVRVPEALLPAARRGLVASAAVHLARLVTCAPPGVATPAAVAEWARAGAAAVGAGCEVLDADGLRAGGYGAVLAVGAGSAHQPHLVRVSWDGRPADPARPGGSGSPADLVVVGKGVTFDSGGLSLKSPAAMQDMRSDCAGAAVALATVLSLAAQRAPVAVEALLPLAENLPGPGATRPGDVVRSRSGRLVQVLDTDFEGRVLLADALTDACAARPRLVVDVATLTYQAVVALGPDIGALLARDDSAAASVLDAARRAGEPLWRLPLADRYRARVDVGWALRNHPLTDSGRAITAALFLDAFVPPEQPWAHLDVAGPSWRGDASADGATGFGVRTLLELARSLTGSSAP